MILLAVVTATKYETSFFQKNYDFAGGYNRR